ncbi:MAG: beta strand repeat-containing protein, partial [Phycisphaerales bacterium]
VTVSPSSVSETPGMNTSLVTFTRTGPTTAALMIPYTIGGTATAGDDYTALSGMIVFAMGSSTATLMVEAIDDNTVETSETVTILVVATANYGVQSGADSVMVTILDDEPTISVAVTTASTSETPGSAAARFTFTRTGPLTNAFAFSYTIGGTATNTTDYGTLSGVLTFDENMSTVTLDIVAVNDMLVEVTETVTVTINADTSYRIADGAGSAAVSILDDEPTISIVATDDAAQETGLGTGLFTLTRTGPTTSEFMVTITIGGTATNGTDYQMISTTVTFLAGSATATVDLTPIDDADVEGNETVTLTIAASTAYRIDGGAGAATATIFDNESVVSITSLDGVLSESTGDTARVRFSRVGAAQLPLTVMYTVTGTATNGTDYVALTGSIVIPADQTTVTLTLSALADALREGTETIILTLAASSDYSIDDMAAAATLRLTDDEANPAPAADLSATITLATALVRPTQVVNGTLVVRNSGAVTADGFTTRIVLSTDNIFGNADDVLVTEITVNGAPIARGQSRSAAFMVTVPADLAPGAYFILAKTDHLGELTEVNEANNISRSTAANLTVAPAPTISIAASDRAAGETQNGAAANGGRFTFTRTGPTGTALTVNYVVGGSAGPGTDYTALSGTVTFAVGSTTATVDISVLNDLLAEGTENVIVGIGRGEGYSINLTKQSATVNIADNEPIVTIQASDAAASETAGNGGRYTVRRTGPTTTALTVAYTVSGSALSGTDFTALSGTVVIPAGMASATIDLTTIDDAIRENAETVIVTLATSGAYTIGTKSTATVTIADNEPAVSIRAIDVTAGEANDNIARFSVTRTGTRSGNLIVMYTLSGTATNGTDYEMLTGMVTIPDGEASATIVITPLDDTTGEAPETVIVTLAEDAAYAITANMSMVTATISDNEPVVTVVASRSTALETGPTAGRFTVSRTGVRTDALVVNYTISGTATDGADFVTLSGMVTIAAGAASATIDVLAINDVFGEDAESVILTIAPGAGYAEGAPAASATVMIIDNEPTVTVQALDSSASEQGPNGGSFIVTRSGPNTNGLTVTYTVGGTATAGADYAALSGTVTIPAGASSAVITLVPIDDGLGEAPETVTLTLSGNTGYRVVESTGNRAVTIADNEPIVSVQASDGVATEGGTNNGRFTFSRAGSTAQAVNITYTLSGTAGVDDYMALSGTITIPAGMSSASLTLSALADELAEEDETVVLTITGVNGYRPDPDRTSATVAITAAGPVVSITASDPTATEQGATTGRYTIRRTGPTTDDLVVSIEAEGTASTDDYVALPMTVTIPAGQSSVTVTLTPIDDSVGESAETVVLSIIADDEYRIDETLSSATVTITDNEAVVSLAVRDALATEGRATDGGKITVTRVGVKTAAISVSYTIAGSATNGTDFTMLSGTVVIPAGQSSADILIAALSDLVVEGDETVLITLVTGSGYALGTNTQGTVTLKNFGQPDLNVSSVNVMPASISLTTPGQLTTVNITMENLGAALAGPFRVEVRLTANNILGDADDIVLGFFDVDGIAALSTVTRMFVVNWDAVRSPAIGNYFIGTRIDSARRVAESSESNNDTFTPTAAVTIGA